MDTTATRVEQQLTPLRRSVINKPPYLSGTLQPPASSFSLFFKITKGDHTSSELEQLAQACEPTAFGVDGDDESSVKAGKMDVGRFAPLSAPDHTGLDKLLKDYHFEGSQAKNKLTIELLKLNVYGQGSFAHPHIYPPHRVGQRVGSLIIIFPTPHEGGTFFLTHENNKWFFDDGPELAAAPDPTIGYVAFFGDISHAVTPVISGHCVTLTYELYLGDVEPVPGNGSASGNLIPRAHERAFRENLEALLENPEFLPDGGTLGFGLRHVYPINDGIKHVYGLLKGSDAVVYRSACALGFEPLLYMIYEWEPPDMKSTEGGLIERLVDFAEYYPDSEDRLDLTTIIRKEGGIVVCQDLDSYLNEDGAYGRPEKIEWVTPNTTYNEQESTYLNMMGNEPALGFVYGDLCLVLKKVWEKEGNKRPSAFWRRDEY
ncbi:hypothetical protein BC827DRAFT_1272990 [Russula dissimulans]|nr:hypothetical protein BC827DRAFT_1272990 [Russula dissimulans]